MQLCYRGNIYYRSKDKIKLIQDQENRCGIKHDIKQFTKRIDLQPNILQYRGITYLKAII